MTQCFHRHFLPIPCSKSEKDCALCTDVIARSFVRDKVHARPFSCPRFVGGRLARYHRLCSECGLDLEPVINVMGMNFRRKSNKEAAETPEVEGSAEHDEGKWDWSTD